MSVTVAIDLIFTIICLLKGKLITGLLGLPIPFVALEGRFAWPSRHRIGPGAGTQSARWPSRRSGSGRDTRPAGSACVTCSPVGAGPGQPTRAVRPESGQARPRRDQRLRHQVAAGIDGFVWIQLLSLVKLQGSVTS